MTQPKIDPRQIPHSLNGYPVKAFTISANADRALVLCHRENNRLHPWVAATWWPELGDQWQWGNYFASYEEADAYRGNWIGTTYGSTDIAHDDAALEPSESDIDAMNAALARKL